MDWTAWSIESRSMMGRRTEELLAKHDIAIGAPYHWDLDTARIVIGETAFRLVTVGTTADGSFLWAWANDGIPPAARAGLDHVRQFGLEHDLALLTDVCAEGGPALAKECLVIAGRILDAHGIWIDQTDAGLILFALFELAPS